ncbi:MAG: DNA methyltransferase [Phycisphaerales bacterium]
MLEIKRIPIARITPAPYNPRIELKPGMREYDKLARSLGEFGCVEPLVWNKRSGHLVGGHQRLSVLKAQGVTHVEVSVVDLDDGRERALNLALNKIQGGWDNKALAQLLKELADGFELDLDLTGFDPAEIDGLIEDAFGFEQTQDQGAGDLASKAITKPGDLIELGSHRLLCGDCTDVGTVARLMGSERADLFATDPPYLVDYDGTNHPRNKDWSSTYGVSWDDSSSQPDLYRGFIAAAVKAAVHDRTPWYCWHASRRQAMLEAEWDAAGVFVHCQIIWAKNRPVCTRSWYLWQHEPCLMGWKRGFEPKRVSRKKLATVWTYDSPSGKEDRPDHPTPKPVELFELPMRQHTRPGEICYEPFAGSGTQLIAAERLGRRCYALEVSPVYCDVIIRRFIKAFVEEAVDPKLASKYAPDKESASGGSLAARTVEGKPAPTRERSVKKPPCKKPVNKKSATNKRSTKKPASKKQSPLKTAQRSSAKRGSR